METRAHHVLIGSFVVLCTVAMVFVVLWLSKATIERDFAYYDIIFQDEVSGLTPGSAVEYNGINVGDVVDMRLNPDDPRIVQVRIRVSAHTPVKEDTGARLGLANITGTALIRLYGGSPDSPPHRGTESQPAVILAERSALNTLLANSEDLFGDVNDLIQNINSMFSEENTELIGQTLGNIERVTGMLADQQSELEQTLQVFNSTLGQTEKTLYEVSQLARESHQLLNEHGDGLVASAHNTFRALEESSARFERLLEENELALESGLQGMHELGPAISELRRTLKSLSRVSRQFEEDPGSLLLQREQVKEFNP